MSDSIFIRLAEPVPCGVFNADNKSQTCGNPAYVLDMTPRPQKDAWATPGQWIARAICESCVVNAAAQYGIELERPPQLWLTLADVVKLSHEFDPEKYDDNSNPNARQRWRMLVSRQKWKAKGWAMQDEQNHWLLSRAAVEAWLEDNKDKYR